MNKSSTLPIAAGLGALAGLRTFSAPTAVARASRDNYIDLEGTPMSALAGANGAHIIALLAFGEMIVDKTTWIPNRTDPPALIGRAISGGLAGATVAKARRSSWIAGALLGAGAAVLASFAGYELRRRAGKATGLPDYMFAVAEDALVVGSGLALIRALDR